MKHLSLHLCVLVFAIESAAVAQNGGAPDKPTPAPVPAPAIAQDSFDLHSLDVLLGIELRNADKTLGVIDDLVIDPTDGSIDYVIVKQGGVLGVGEERRLVPRESLSFDSKSGKDGRRVATTQLTEERLSYAPKCNRDQRIDADMERRAREAAGIHPPFDPRPAQVVLAYARSVDGAEVGGAGDETLGNLDDLLVDVEGGIVACVVLAAAPSLGLGEKRYALPWGTIQVATDAQNKLSVSSKLTKERLAKAPEYDPKDSKRIQSAAWLRDVYAFHAVAPYWVPKPPAQVEKRQEGTN